MAVNYLHEKNVGLDDSPRPYSLAISIKIFMFSVRYLLLW